MNRSRCAGKASQPSQGKTGLRASSDQSTRRSRAAWRRERTARSQIWLRLVGRDRFKRLVSKNRITPASYTQHLHATHAIWVSIFRSCTAARSHGGLGRWNCCGTR